jgi:hypothetical protein
MALLAAAAFAQTSTSGRLAGTVTDAQGAVVPNAQVIVKNNETQAQFTATANAEGSWILPSISAGSYTVTVTAAGFKTTVVQAVKVDAGQPATVNATLETGAVADQVVVTGGGEVLQNASANISTTITGREIHELPFSTRDALQLVLVMPGVQTPGTPRTSSVNGLPKASLNITLDGANVQDNYLKSTDGFFTTAQPKSDAVEEVTVSTATPGAESAGGGAVQVRFVTKQGSNDFHGSLFWQHRNDALNATYYFNQPAYDNLPKDRILLNQFGGNIGGPITIPKLFNGRDKAFFFVNMEEFRLPQTFGVSRLVLTDQARQGIFTYRDSAGVIRNINLYEKAGARGFTSTPDPMTANVLNLIAGTYPNGVLRDRIQTNSDYNRLNLTFREPARNIRRFPTVRLDFNLTDAHHVEFIHNYQHYFSTPDGVNNIFSIYPGVGSVLGGDGTTGSVYRNTFTFAMAERWTIKSNLINEIRLTSSGNGTSNFRREFGAGQFGLFNGYTIGIPGAPNNAYTAAYTAYTSGSRRNTPVKTVNDNLYWVKGNHEFNFGGSYTRVASWTQDVSNQVVPSIALGVATGDPIITGNTNIFNTDNFPGSTPAQRTEAQNLYAILTGRIASTTRGASFNGTAFELDSQNVYNHLYEVGLYGQDRWKISQNLTLTGGLRWEFAPSPVNDNNVYTRPGAEGVFGVSGLGNLFKPGVYEGELTQFRLLQPGEKAFQNTYNNFAPSIGFAWTPDIKSLSRIFGERGQTVLRGGYSIAYVREGFNAFNSMFGGNDGLNFATGTSPANNPDVFGIAGSKLLRDASYPFLPVPSPNFPITGRQGVGVNDYDANLRPGYVQSWTFGIQRELTKDMALEVRYVGNRAAKLWGQYEIGEVNIFENGFLNEFKAAQQNLRIFRQANPNCGRTGAPACNYGNSKLPGQVDIPIIKTAIGNDDLNTLTSLDRGEAGRLAASIAQNAGRMNSLIKDQAAIVKPITLPDPNNPGQNITLSNFFVANPRAPTNSFLMDNIGEANYHALQVELRRRLSKGLLVQGSYVWAKAIANTFNQSASVDGTTPTSFRDLSFNRSVAPRDIRHGLKFDWIYELPFGPGKRFLSNGPSVIRKALEAWQFSGVARIQSGTPTRLLSDRQTFNNREAGVVLHNMTRKQLQDMVDIRKSSVCNANGACQGVVYWLPQDVIDNTMAAFEVGGKTLADLDLTKPYIGPPTTPGELGANVFLYGPWTSRYDLSLMKRVHIREKMNFELRANFLNAFNQSSITIRAPGDNTDTETIGASFGQTRNAFRDFSVSGTNDPGGRLIEFQLRFNF